VKASGTSITYDNSTYLTSVTAHNLLSTTHGDTTADTVVRGDIITGQGATPKWTRLAFPGTPTGKCLVATATDVAWSASALGTAAYTASTDYVATGTALLLDQTTPQTISNGMPSYADGHGEFTDQHMLVDKEYVDSAVAVIGARFYMLDAADGDIAAYKSTSVAASALATASVSASVDAATNTIIEEWVSPTGFDWTILEAGVYDLNVFAAKTAGNRAVRVFWRFYERKADTSEVLIATSNLSELVTSKARIRVYATLTSAYTPSASSRLVGKIYFNTVGGSQNTTCVLYYQGDEDSNWEIPLDQEFLDDNYLRLDGGTMTGNLLFTDNTLDIGASGATRPRTGYFGTSVVSPAILASANDSGALGASGTAFSDLFLASGGVINWLAGEVTLTHSSNTLTLSATTLALGATNITMSGSIGVTGTRVTKGWFTDLEVTNTIVGSVDGRALQTEILAIAYAIAL
jgi:hypothetical protein